MKRLCHILLLIISFQIGNVANINARPGVDTSTPSRVLHLNKKPGVGVWQLLNGGGMYRQGDSYLTLSSGIGDLIGLNAVDGVSVGPHFVAGKVLSDGARFEVEPLVRYSLARNKLLGYAKVRYYFPLQTSSMIELLGGRYSADFDSESMMSNDHAELAGALFGWNHQKYYDLAHFGFNITTPLSDDLQTHFGWQWQRRSRLDNHQNRTLFGHIYQDNLPRNYRHPIDSWMTDSVLNFPTQKLWLWKLRLDYRHDARLLIADDMTSELRSRYPTFSLSFDAATSPGKKDVHFWRYGKVELAIRQSVEYEYSRWQYFAGIGTFISPRDVMLVDYKHFDAADYVWQERNTLTWFALLSNYQFSTDRRWVELHGEWMSSRMLLSRLFNHGESRLVFRPAWTEYLQWHALQVPHARFYSEIAYGWDFWRAMRIGVVCGFKAMQYDGIALQVVLDLKNMAAMSR